MADPELSRQQSQAFRGDEDFIRRNFQQWKTPSEPSPEPMTTTPPLSKTDSSSPSAAAPKAKHRDLEQLEAERRERELDAQRRRLLRTLDQLDRFKKSPKGPSKRAKSSKYSPKNIAADDPKARIRIPHSDDLLWPQIPYLLRVHRTRLRPRSYEMFEHALGYMHQWLKGTSWQAPAEAETDDLAFFLLAQPAHLLAQILANWMSAMLRKGLLPNTMGYRIVAIRSLFRTARTLGFTMVSPICPVPTRFESCQNLQGPGLAQLRRVVSSLGERTDVGAVQDLALIRLIVDLDLRANEVAKLRRCDVDLKAGTIKVTLKGRSVPTIKILPAQTAAALQNWLAVDRQTFSGRRPHDYKLSHAVFHGWRVGAGGHLAYRCGGSPKFIHDRLQKLSKAFSLKLGPQRLRHASATIACELTQAKGLPIELVLAHTGHKSLKTLLQYRDGLPFAQGQISSLVAQAITPE